MHSWGLFTSCKMWLSKALPCVEWTVQCASRVDHLSPSLALHMSHTLSRLIWLHHGLKVPSNVSPFCATQKWQVSTNQITTFWGYNRTAYASPPPPPFPPRCHSTTGMVHDHSSCLTAQCSLSAGGQLTGLVCLLEGGNFDGSTASFQVQKCQDPVVVDLVITSGDGTVGFQREFNRSRTVLDVYHSAANEQGATIRVTVTVARNATHLNFSVSMML